MSQSVKSESSSILNPIENILESLSFSNNKPITSTISTPDYTTQISTESITSSLAFKIIIILIILLAGIIGYSYLEKEVNQWIENIKNYFETKKYTKKEKEHAEEQEKQKEIESENTPKEQTIEDIIKNVQTDIKKKKK
jgi:predicted PurR-regulated permease PerM